MVKEKKVFLFQTLKKRQNITFSPVFIIAFFCAIFSYTGIFKYSPPTLKSIFPLDSITFIQGTVKGNPIKKGDKYKFLFSVTEVGCVNFLSNNKREIRGCAFGEIDVYLDKNIVEALYPGKLFSISQYLKNHVVIENGAILTINGNVNVLKQKNNSYDSIIFYGTTCSQNGWGSVFPKLTKFRALCRLALKRLLFSWGEAGGLLLALLTGSREYTSKDIADGFTNAGLAHILALSGMHLSIFSGLALNIGRFIFGKKIGSILSIIAVILFALFAGLSPSLLRALICSIAVTVTSLCNLTIPYFKILCFSFIIHSCISPGDLFTLSFQLSYGALVGLLLFSSFFSTTCFRFIPSVVSNSISSSTGAQTSTLPVCASAFGKIPVGGIISSVVVAPIASAFVTVGTVSIIISLVFPDFSDAVGFIVNVLYYCLKFMVLLLAKIPALEVI